MNMRSKFWSFSLFWISTLLFLLGWVISFLPGAEIYYFGFVAVLFLVSSILSTRHYRILSLIGFGMSLLGIFMGVASKIQSRPLETQYIEPANSPKTLHASRPVAGGCATLRKTNAT